MYSPYSKKYAARKNCSNAINQSCSVSVTDIGCLNQRLYHSIFKKVPARLVLYFLSWSGFLVSFMMRNDINFALVAMTQQNEEINIFMKSNYTDKNVIQKMSVPAILSQGVIKNKTIAKISEGLFSRSIIHTTEDNTDYMNEYEWSSTVKSIIISSFYWCYVLSQVAGGVATQYFGTKHVFGWSQFITACCSILIPLCADIHYTAVIVLRSIQGFASGLTWPAMYAIVGFWIPPAERSRFMSSFQGFSIGIGLTYPLCGFLIDNLGWRYVFYTTGSLGMFWCLLWYLLAFNTPREHPRISSSELEYIEQSVSCEVNESLGMEVPWKNIFSSKPAWAIAITTFGRIWIHYIFIVCGPNFMKNMLKFKYKTNGFISGMPFICSYFSSVLYCYLADKILLHNLLNLTTVRKMFTALSQITPAVLILWIGYIDQNISLLLVLWFTAVTFITASYAGAMANIVDIAPNLAGPVLAFCQTIHMSASFISPLVSGIIVTNEQSIEQWRNIFRISAAVAVCTYIFYQIFGSANIQKWNYPKSKNDGTLEESEILKDYKSSNIANNEK